MVDVANVIQSAGPRRNLIDNAETAEYLTKVLSLSLANHIVTEAWEMRYCRQVRMSAKANLTDSVHNIVQ